VGKGAKRRAHASRFETKLHVACTRHARRIARAVAHGVDDDLVAGDFVEN
jgi:hypothetical protein